MTDQTATATTLTDVSTVAIPTTDHERALAFYAGTLGMETRRDATFGPGFRWVEVAPSGAATTIALAPARGPAGVDTGIRLATPDAAAAHASLLAAGVDVDAELLNMPPAPLMFSLRDPDGNTLYIVERR